MKVLIKKELKENLLKFIMESILLIGTAVSLVPYGYRLTTQLNINFINLGKLGNQIAAMLPKLKDLNYFIYSQWFGKNLFEIALLFAVINAAGIIAGETERKSSIFLFSRPLSRNKILLSKLIVVLFYTLIPIVVSTYIILPLSRSIPQQVNIAVFNKLLLESLVATTVAVLITTTFSIIIDDRVKTGLAAFGIIIGTILIGTIKPIKYISFANLYVGKFGIYFPIGLALCIIFAVLSFVLLNRKEF